MSKGTVPIVEDSEERFRRVFDRAAAGIAITDCAGRFIECNASYCSLTGYNQAELAALDFPALIHPEDRECNLGFIRQLLDGEVPSFEIENRYVRKDGRPIWVHKHVSLLRDDRGLPTNIVAFVTDTTERRRTEDVLRFLGQCGVSAAGEGFFRELAHYLAQALDMDFVCIDRLEQGNLSAQTLAVYHNGRFEDNVSYALKDTPCGTVVGQRICSFPRNVRGLFPRDAVLQDLRAESYLGTTLWSAQGKPIGLIAIIGRQPLVDTRPAEAILQLLAIRAAGELERLQAEERLRESEERFRAIASSTPDHILVQDRALRYSFVVNPQLGFSEQDMIGKTDHDFLAPDDAEKLTRIKRQVLETGHPVQIETPVSSPEGETQIFSGAFVPRRDAAGQVDGLIGYFSNVTDRKRAEQALRASEERLRLALAAGAMATWDWHIPSGAVIWNDEHYRMLGYEVGAVQPSYRAWADRMHPDDVAATEALLRQSMEQGTEYAAEFRVLMPDASVRWLEARGKFDLDGAGKAVRSYGVMLDITTRKQAEEALRQAHGRLAMAQQSAGAGMWDWDMTTEKLEWSPELFRLFGLDLAQDEATFDTWRRVLHPEDREAAAERIREAVQNHVRLESEYRVVLASGEERWVRSMGDTAYAPDGRPLRMSGICINITGRKRVEEELRHARVAALNLLEDTAEARQTAEQISAELRVREELLRLFIDHAPAAIAMLDNNMCYVAASRRWLADYGLQGQDVTGRSHYEVFPEIPERWKEIHRRGLAGEVMRAEEDPFDRADGTRQWLHWEVHPWKSAPDTIGGIVISSDDITERKRREEQLQKLNRALNALGHSGQALMRATGEADFVQAACRIVREDCGYAMVWIGFAANDEAKSILPAACAGFEDGYLDTLKLTWADSERGHGPTGTAVRTGQVCRCLDMLADPAFLPWREQARKRGYASSIALPLLADGRAFGALTIYSPEPDGFTAEEVKLLTDLAADFSQGITWLRTRAAKERAEAAVRESEERYRALFETMTEGFALHEIVTDAQGRPCDYRFLDVNPAFERLTGLRRHDLLGKRVLEVLPGTETHWIENYGRVALTGESLHLEEYSAALARWYDISAYRVAPGRFAVVFADISPRKSAEEKIWNLNRDLEERVRDRTAELRASEGRLRRLAAQFATAQDEEQQRIAEALHDDVAQILAACSVKLAVATAVADPAAVGKCHGELQALLHEANEKVRLMSFELGTATLYRLGLEEAVGELAESMEERHGIRIAVNSDGECRRLDSASGVVLYKAVRELLFNVVKHAGTSEAAVSILSGNGQLTVAVEDRGRGFTHPPSAAGVSVGSGLGLFGIRERVGDLGGTVHIESEPGVRTCITLTVPLSETH